MKNSLNFPAIHDRPEMIMLCGLLVLGGMLRFYGLEIQSLWNDELSTWYQINHGSLAGLIKEAGQDPHPRGYFVLLYFLQEYFGNSEFVLRLPSAIAGTFSIWAIFLLGKRLYSAKEGLLAALFMTVLWCPIYYSQEARSYSLLLLFVLWAMYFWIACLADLENSKTPTLTAVIGYLASAIITCYLHYYGLFFIALQGLLATVVLFKRMRSLFFMFGMYALILFFYIPGFLMLLSQLSSKDCDWIPETGPDAFFSYLKFVFNKSSPPTWLTIFLCGFLLINSLRHRKTNQAVRLSDSPTLLLVLWFFVPFLIIYVASVLLKPILVNRYLIILLPAVYLLLARAITQLPVKRRGMMIIVAGIAIVSLGDLFFLKHYYTRPQKAQFREAIEWIIHEKNHYPNAMIIGFANDPSYFDYYFKQKNQVQLIASNKEDIPMVAEYINKQKPAYIWYVAAFKNIAGQKTPDPEFIGYLQKNLVQVDYKSFKGTGTWLFRRSGTGMLPSIIPEGAPADRDRSNELSNPD